MNSYDLKLPVYLRRFTSGSIYCKILSSYASDILERLKKHEEANEIYSFLLEKQNTYLQTSRARWFLRMALNYESHMKMPREAFEVLVIGLQDKQFVRNAGRLSLYTRLVKMSETKRYLKIKELKDGFSLSLKRCSFPIREAPVREIEGTLLHSEFIPGRKNIFVQNFEAKEISEDSCQSQSSESSVSAKSYKSSRVVFSNTYDLSVEQVALKHYIENLGKKLSIELFDSEASIW